LSVLYPFTLFENNLFRQANKEGKIQWWLCIKALWFLMQNVSMEDKCLLKISKTNHANFRLTPLKCNINLLIVLFDLVFSLGTFHLCICYVIIFLGSECTPKCLPFLCAFTFEYQRILNYESQSRIEFWI